MDNTLDENKPSPVHLIKLKRLRLSTDWSRCIVCQKDTKEPLSTAQSAGMKSLKAATEMRSDVVLQRLETELENVDDLLSRNDVRYHRKCFQTYTSRTNMVHVKSPDKTEHTDDKENSPLRLTRSQASVTDWSKCIICQKRRDGTTVHTVHTEAREDSIRNAALARQDQETLLRITGKSLVEQKANYHNSCIASYTSKSNLSKRKSDEDQYNIAFNKLMAEIDNDLFVCGKALGLPALLTRYRALLPKNCDGQGTYRQRSGSKGQGQGDLCHS